MIILEITLEELRKMKNGESHAESAEEGVSYIFSTPWPPRLCVNLFPYFSSFHFELKYFGCLIYFGNGPRLFQFSESADGHGFV